ncbi:TPA: hypothetical protein ACKRTJ_003564 [Proteus mirabilis]|uniref:hypothetical protein n=1 Tax=Proteus TaxID=583 RepID=UPI00036AF585|nr:MULTISPECIES: hypothetical protein [Proteus]AUU39867.1 hypothetical protein MC73_013085 [Proteus mirabilis]EKU0928242.1 hypothetical protein [Proteus mirabilis]EKU7865179.1 hypothetical protein [Proteus mirabilis]EKU7879398.1 hypothetical protein [Proteus mirabilis]EKV7295779.1 hypothetical protein [Proteus mirabilis]
MSENNNPIEKPIKLSEAINKMADTIKEHSDAIEINANSTSKLLAYSSMNSKVLRFLVELSLNPEDKEKAYNYLLESTKTPPKTEQHNSYEKDMIEYLDYIFQR